MDFIDHPTHAADPGHNFLGDLLLMEAEQAISEEKNGLLLTSTPGNLAKFDLGPAFSASRIRN